MPREKVVFEKEDLHLIEIPIGFYQKSAFTPLDLYPVNQGF
jgi:hypothetical protein